jgi:threonine dehydrogenase-like Zn-dependent dehydrogenase
MKAAVLCDVRRFEIREVPTPDPSPRDVVIRVAAVGLCGTDFHIYEGRGNYNTDRLGQPLPLRRAPQILGHENAGVVEAVGREVHDLKPGDRVIVDQGINCVSAGRPTLCEYCASADSHQCERYQEHGLTGLPGGMAEHMVVPAVNCVRCDEGVPNTEAALVEPLACVVHAMEVAQRARGRYHVMPQHGESRARSVLVAGAGPAGLLFVQYLRRALGYDGHIFVSEPNPARRTLAASFGAEVIDPGSVDIAEAILDRTSGRRVEWLIDAAGVGALFRQMPLLTRKQATVLLYAHGQTDVELSVLNQLQFREPTLVATAGGSGGFDPDGRPTVYRRALALIEEGTIEVSRFVTHRYGSLEQVPEAFGGPDRHAPDYIKAVLELD